MSNSIDMKAGIVGVILAGGRSSRMNFEDKPLLELGGKPIIEHIIANARTQVGDLVVSVNKEANRYQRYGLPLISDSVHGYAGPLAGILAAIQWCLSKRPNTQYIVSLPGDAPWFPDNLVNLLHASAIASTAETAWIINGRQKQPLFALWSTGIRESLQQALDNNVYSPMAFLQSTKNVVVQITGSKEGDFENLNNPTDLARARALAAENNLG